MTTMTPIYQFAEQELFWVPATMQKQLYELTAGSTILATLDMSNWTSSALALTSEGYFSLQHEGFFKQQVMIRVNESHPIIGTYTRGWSGGVLQLADDRLFKWSNANFWGTKKIWQDASATTLVHFQSSPWTRELLVKLEPEAIAIPEHPLLVILGLYITLLGHPDLPTA